MKLSVCFSSTSGADGTYRVHAKGYLLAKLHWANVEGPLPDWTSFGIITLNQMGEGQFNYDGGRAIPVEATHVAAVLITADTIARETLIMALPPKRLTAAALPDVRFIVASDFHLSVKHERIRRALRLGRNADCILLCGDMTNDGDPAQLEMFRRCIEEELPDVPVLSVAGNHDYPLKPIPLVFGGCEDYYHFQAWLLNRAKSMGVECAQDKSGAYSATVRGIAISGLNAVSHWRRFVFPRGDQINWLRARLNTTPNVRHVILCHAPLITHCPARKRNDLSYLSRDAALQQVIDDSRSIIFLSGHTHLSLNELQGCVSYDEEKGNLYINDSSAVATTLKTPEPRTDHTWTEGAALQLCVYPTFVEIVGIGITHGAKIARAYYRFSFGHAITKP